MNSKEHENADFSSEDEEYGSQLLINPKGKTGIQREVVEESISDEVSDGIYDDTKIEEDISIDGDHDNELFEERNNVTKENTNLVSDQILKRSYKMEKQLSSANKLKHKTGVIYFSSIPPYMKPAKMRQILSRFGNVDRLFLKREDDQKHRQRTRGGGNKKAMYEEGWAEFISKRNAKLCAQTLNGNIIGGKKGTFYHDDILNVKYLPGFKWADLTEQIARENDIRQAKLEVDISFANKLNAEFTKNVEKSKMITNIKRSKKRANNREGGDDNNDDFQRTFKQHRVATSRANASHEIKPSDSSKDLGSVLNNLL